MVTELYAALQEDSEARRMGAADVLRSLVREIVLTPDTASGELQIEVHGDIAGILTIALERKKPADGAGGSQFEMVAGAHFQKFLPLHQASWDDPKSLAA